MSKLAINGGEATRIHPFTARRTMGDTEKKAVIEVMESGELSGFFGSPCPQWLGGKKVREFERKWADNYGYKHAISVNSWTTGLMTAVGAMGIGPGDEVIVSPYTMSATATAILFYGGIPVFADIDPDTFNITASTIEPLITCRTKAIMVVHIFGQTSEMQSIMALARKQNLKVIEDGAQSPGVKYKGEPICGFGDIGGFSLNYHKHIHTGEGGMLVTNDDQVALRCQLIRNHGENLVDVQPIEDLTNMLGSNYRLTELQAAIGIAQLDRLDGYVSHRQHLASFFAKQLDAIPGLTPAKVAEGAEHAYYLFPVKYAASSTGISRTAFVRAVNAELPPAKVWEQTGFIEGYIKPLYLAPLYQNKVAMGRAGFPWNVNTGVEYNYSMGICPVAERMYNHDLIYTPLIREPLTVADIDDFVVAIQKVLANPVELSG
ncbi:MULTISPECIES: DegT/DnrJ/EryC1/StrS aminotransferase family protein [unclassified Cyanobium]|uniref:DegT/DnrJ/EryC1/StrS family aminotransferase n=1 Tax=unclassified Cyanobium TaxID=2627006 RepID=UPI0020CE251D|nr:MULTISPECIES: DegT/DnrJ/EryC1/StrS family aminotransferase [unclassified Cyanobium]MCP9861148.1 DegT/DnrJ/EryC1/StrS family aminotransferase [Cyanobium sp. Cruz-8H5]MCP9868415.1 DegT/DnrJ/EryC1/StrS family aminotransferase [Cyanobium sp. Cruz-8D1]